ncbi:MAG: FAD-binding protein [Spirochaetes bacterium]|nr:MAG: FAD-binding protein [Spirochaetota bacterium]
MKNDRYDIIIAGAGPAGSTLARLLGSRYRILVIEKRPLLRPPRGVYQGIKCCGGLLAPDAQETLARLGLGVPLAACVGPQIFTVRTIDFDNGLERYYQRHYLNMDREAFDRWLLSLVPGSVDVRCGCRLTGFAQDASGVSVRFLQGTREYTARGRILAGADGASSRVRAALFPGEEFRTTYLAIQEWVRADAPLPYFSAIFDRAVTDFYSWTIPKDGHLIVGAALAPRDEPWKKFALLKEKLTKYGYRFPRAGRTKGTLLLRPARAGQVRCGAGRTVLVGEAAGFISPTSAEGISYALRSAMAFADAAAGGDLDTLLPRYRRESAPLVRSIIAKTFKAPFMYNAFLRALVMRAGVRGMKMYGER